MKIVDRNRLARANYLRRLADYIENGEFCDLRTQDQRDLGIVLTWRQRVARREIDRQPIRVALPTPVPMFLRPQAE